MNEKLQKLYELTEEIYATSEKELLFHGWHHVNFVYNKSKVFASELKVDTEIVQAAALVHDFNHIVSQNSTPQEGAKLREDILKKAGYETSEREKIENIVLEEDIRTRDNTISKEAQALSDADTLFKILPTTPILFTGRYLSENNVDIKALARKIVSEQEELLESGIYFYTPFAKETYGEMAQTHLKLWKEILQSFEDEDVVEMLKLAGILD